MAAEPTMLQRNAYAAVKEHYGLKAKQRDLLDRSPYYAGILNAATALDWDRVTGLLFEGGIISLAEVIHASEG